MGWLVEGRLVEPESLGRAAEVLDEQGAVLLAGDLDATLPVAHHLGVDAGTMTVSGAQVAERFGRLLLGHAATGRSEAVVWGSVLGQLRHLTPSALLHPHCDCERSLVRVGVLRLTRLRTRLGRRGLLGTWRARRRSALRA